MDKLIVQNTVVDGDEITYDVQPPPNSMKASVAQMQKDYLIKQLEIQKLDLERQQTLIQHSDKPLNIQAQETADLDQKISMLQDEVDHLANVLTTAKIDLPSPPILVKP